MFLERPVHDVDLATNLPWPLVQKAFRDEGWGTVETGVAHGTLTVVRDGEPLEITTYRCDGTYRYLAQQVLRRQHGIEGGLLDGKTQLRGEAAGSQDAQGVLARPP